jgi:molybdenum cofactor biosynthesis enzyme MoaA
MKIQTFSILAGSEACNARCPFCVSKMTPHQGMNLKEPEVNWRNFRKAATLAKMGDTTTAMLTGKGEPTLFPDQISKYMTELEKYDFPFVELQTNGMSLMEQQEKYEPFLKDWYHKGMTSIAISVVHYDPSKNREVYAPHKDDYMDLPDLIKHLHREDRRFSVRLSTILVDGYIDSANKLEQLIDFAKENNVEQLTISPVNKPKESDCGPVYDWTNEHHLKPEQFAEIKKYVMDNGTPVLKLPHGAVVFDIKGQNVCLSNCLTNDTDPEKIRQLIFFPDGHLRYSWEFPGAILI